MMDPIRFSRLKALALSPAHYKYGLTAPDEPSRAMRIGTAVHAAVLGDNPALDVFPGPTRRGKEWEVYKAAHAGQTILARDEADEVVATAAAVEANPAALKLLKQPHREERIAWKWLGLDCAGTPDAWDGTTVVDLKTARTAQPERFGKEVFWRYYHAQLAWYCNGLELSGRAKPERAYIVAVETAPPYPVVIYEITETALAQGFARCREWMERLKGCIENDYWPGYSDAVVPIEGITEMPDLTFAETD